MAANTFDFFHVYKHQFSQSTPTIQELQTICEKISKKNITVWARFLSNIGVVWIFCQIHHFRNGFFELETIFVSQKTPLTALSIATCCSKLKLVYLTTFSTLLYQILSTDIIFHPSLSPCFVSSFLKPIPQCPTSTQLLPSLFSTIR